MTVYTFVYFLGIASCGMQGAEKMTRQSGRTSLSMLCAGLNSFGGGFIRDVFLLSVFPVVLTPECLPDITVAMVAALLYLNARQNCLTQNAVKWFTVIADAGGLGTFITIGVDKAIDLGTGTLSAILSGIVTSQGGGVAAAVFSGTPLLWALSTNVAYRLMAVGGVLLYSWWTGVTADRISSQYAVILYTTIGALACDQMVTTEINKRLSLVMDSDLLCPALVTRDRPLVFAPRYDRFFWYCREAEKATSCMVMACRKRTLLYHCMRLM